MTNRKLAGVQIAVMLLVQLIAYLAVQLYAIPQLETAGFHESLIRASLLDDQTPEKIERMIAAVDRLVRDHHRLVVMWAVVGALLWAIWGGFVASAPSPRHVGRFGYILFVALAIGIIPPLRDLYAAAQTNLLSNEAPAWLLLGHALTVFTHLWILGIWLFSPLMVRPVVPLAPAYRF